MKPHKHRRSPDKNTFICASKMLGYSGHFANVQIKEKQQLKQTKWLFQKCCLLFSHVRSITGNDDVPAARIHKVLNSNKFQPFSWLHGIYNGD